MGLLGGILLAAALAPGADHARLFPRLSAGSRHVAYVREAHPDRSEIAVIRLARLR